MRKTLTEQEIEQKMNETPLWVLNIQNEMNIEKRTQEICNDFNIKEEFFNEILYCVNMVALGLYKGEDFLEYIKELLKDYDKTLPISLISEITEKVFSPLRKKIKEYEPPKDILSFTERKNDKKEEYILFEEEKPIINNVYKEKITTPYNFSSAGIEIEEKQEEDMEMPDKQTQITSQKNLEELTNLTIPKKPKK